MPLSGSFTSNFQNAVLDVLSGKGILDAPLDGLKLGLFTADPGESGGTSSELTGNGYARATFSVGAAATNGSYQGEISNSAQIDFPSATGTWSGITHAAVFRTKSYTSSKLGTTNNTNGYSQMGVPASHCTVAATLTVISSEEGTTGSNAVMTQLNLTSHTSGTYTDIDSLGTHKYFIRVKSGRLAGLCFDIDTDGTNFLVIQKLYAFDAEDFSGQTVEVLQKPTVQEFFGAVPTGGGSLASGLLSGDTATSDRIYIVDSASTSTILFPQYDQFGFYGGTGWRRQGDTANDPHQPDVLLHINELITVYDNLATDDYCLLETRQTADWTLTSQLSTTDDLVVRLAFEDSGGNPVSPALSVTSGQNLQIASGDLKITLD